jgi:hypothetical protein
MIIVSFVKKETEVGIMIVHQLLYMVDTEVESQYNHTNVESSEVGSTTERLNGSKEWFFGVTDSTKRYGRFSKGSNPLGTTI